MTQMDIGPLKLIIIIIKGILEIRIQKNEEEEDIIAQKPIL